MGRPYAPRFVLTALRHDICRRMFRANGDGGKPFDTDHWRVHPRLASRSISDFLLMHHSTDEYVFYACYFADHHSHFYLCAA